MQACVDSMHRTICATCGWTTDNRGPFFKGWVRDGNGWRCSQCATGQHAGNAHPDEWERA